VPVVPCLPSAPLPGGPPPQPVVILQARAGPPTPSAPEFFMLLTPAEEMGLSGLNLAARVRKAFDKIPEETVVRLLQRIREESTRRHLIYLRDGQTDTIRVLPLPLTVLPDQLGYLHAVSLTVQNAP